MADNRKTRVGHRGEELAAAELERAGLRVLERNWRCRLGEIDIIAEEGGGADRTIVFCEVKCRSGLGYGDPLEAITYAKLRRLRQLSAEWLSEHGPPAAGIRLDAVGVLLVAGAPPVVNHVRGIG
ncbi:YraN family protein [Microlunatus speluncae]|uniref:YraN family protein n=1 Tax=Microlunatus speluncae TaxID=2594267 RepID=UPI0012667B23|nr:YraN family protein [Microlunatus speluncae]